jgi:hypothetical protein
MVIIREKKASVYIKRMLYESLEFDSLEQARDSILPYFQKTLGGLKVNANVIATTKIVVFNLISANYKIRVWWQGLKSPDDPYMIFSDKIVKHTNNLNDTVSILKQMTQNWRPPESSLNMNKILAVIALASHQKQYKFFGFRGDARPVRIGQILGASFNAMGTLSNIDNTTDGRLPGTSSMGIPLPINQKNIALAWRAFTSVHYGNYHSLVGGRTAQLGDDALDVRMNDRDYNVEEYVIKGAEVLLLV